jgi:hypothetical protein
VEQYYNNRGAGVMNMRFILAGVAAAALLALSSDAQARGGWSGGAGAFHSGGQIGGFHAGGFHGGGFHGRDGHFHHRFFGSGISFYAYPYPWWWDWDYGYYPWPYYYGYDAYYSGPYDSSSDPQFNSVRGIQAALAWRGYYSGRIDGMMGPETRNAIRTFQAHEGLPVTGQIDSRLVDALRRR